MRSMSSSTTLATTSLSPPIQTRMARRPKSAVPRGDKSGLLQSCCMRTTMESKGWMRRGPQRTGIWWLRRVVVLREVMVTMDLIVEGMTRLDLGLLCSGWRSEPTYFWLIIASCVLIFCGCTYIIRHGICTYNCKKRELKLLIRIFEGRLLSSSGITSNNTFPIPHPSLLLYIFTIFFFHSIHHHWNPVD